MKSAKSLTTLVAALAVAACASQALAAGRGSAGDRESAIKRCNAEARRHYGGIYYNWGDARDFAYEHCMFDAGFPP